MDDHSEPEFSMGSLLHAAAVWATYWPHTLATATLACTLLAVHLRKFAPLLPLTPMHTAPWLAAEAELCRGPTRC